MAENWCTIESDPGVFTEVIENFGVEGVQVEEIYDLDPASFADLAPVYGLVFLFKWKQEEDPRPIMDAASEPDLFFATQVINNACATQALLSILMNIPSSQVNLGSTLQEFKSFSSQFPPDLKGLAISNSDTIRRVHNSFSRQEPFVIEESKATEKDDVFHFIAYVPFNGKVYELDGLKAGPILLGEGDDWLSVARPAVQARIERYASSEVRFNLMAVIKNRSQVAHENMGHHRQRVERIDSRLALLESSGSLPPVAPDESDPEFTLASTLEDLREQQVKEQSAIEGLQRLIEDEDRKFRTWREENVRRKHNYIPFVMSLLKVLAEKGMLKGMVEAAKKKAADAQAMGGNKVK
uniref:Ubiquitin carboxyl-terminal hydrolase n=1 Tax=Nannochloropsis gaditana (strain CCMP526) TaxID=1093141 RepID=I2CPD4_NANGC